MQERPVSSISPEHSTPVSERIRYTPEQREDLEVIRKMRQEALDELLLLERIRNQDRRLTSEDRAMLDVLLNPSAVTPTDDKILLNEEARRIVLEAFKAGGQAAFEAPPIIADLEALHQIELDIKRKAGMSEEKADVLDQVLGAHEDVLRREWGMPGKEILA